MTKPITTRVHGMLDYLTAGALPVLPRLLSWSDTSSRLLTGLAGATVLYSLLTRYELGAIKLLPMQGHLALDVLNGLTVLGAGLALRGQGSAERAGLIGLGLFELSVSMLTETAPPISAERPAHIMG